MARNKIIVSVSDAVIVIEAGERGGTMNAGSQTLAMGKNLFVAKYGSSDPVYLGNEALIKKGGFPLNRSRNTGRAELKRVLESIIN